MRRINILVKSRLCGGKSGLVRRDVIDVLLSLRIKEVDLEKEQIEEMTPKRKIKFEERNMLSKRRRKVFHQSGFLWLENFPRFLLITEGQGYGSVRKRVAGDSSRRE